MKDEEVQGTKRAKEGKIGDVIKNISKWLSLYKGTDDTKKRVGLDAAAG